MTIILPHKLGKAEARARIERGFGQFKAQMAGANLAAMEQGWEGDRLSFSAQALGQRFTGRIDVREDDLKIEVDLPAFLVGLADKIAGKLRKQGTLLLEKK
ncbi:MAG: polyhydroxyalkanoic acid system family protein [Hyphomonadaceae bacterium]